MTNCNTNNKMLERLLIDDGELFISDRQLFDLLKGKVLLSNTGRVIWEKNPKKMTVAEVVLTYILAKKAMVRTGIVNREGVRPVEIEKNTKLSGGAIRPTIKRMIKSGKIYKLNKRYYVSGTSIIKHLNHD